MDYYLASLQLVGVNCSLILLSIYIDRLLRICMSIRLI